MIFSLTACGTAPITPTSTAIPQTPTTEATVTSTAVPNIYLLAYALRDQYGNFEVVLTDKGVQQAVFTNGPTFEMVNGKLVEVASKEVEEHEIFPVYTEEISRDFLGVRINAELIVDKSIESLTKKVSIPETIFTEYIARCFFIAWWENGTEKHVGTPTQDDFKLFMGLWSKAQQSNEKKDWGKVQFSIWANDLDDGDGNIQKEMTVWPMYFGTTPEGVKKIMTVSIDIVDGTKVKNVSVVEQDYGFSLGTNIDKETLYIYFGPSVFLGKECMSVYMISKGLSAIPAWLSRNSSITKFPPEDKALTKLLENGGLWTDYVQ